MTYQSDEYYTQEEFLAFIDVLNAEDEEDIIDAISNFQEIKDYNDIIEEQYFS